MKPHPPASCSELRSEPHDHLVPSSCQCARRRGREGERGREEGRQGERNGRKEGGREREEREKKEFITTDM